MVLAGPNIIGKTTVLQAIASWSLALHRWPELNDPIRRTSVALPGPSTRTATIQPWTAGSSRSTYTRPPAAASGASVSSPTRSTNVSEPNTAPGRGRSPQASGPLSARRDAQPQPVVGQGQHRLCATGDDRVRDDDIAASTQPAESGCVAAIPSNQLRTSFVRVADTGA